MKTNRLSLNQVTVSVTDIERSFQFYKELGLLPIVKSPHYARFIAPGNEATFSIETVNSVSSTTTVYFEVDDVDRLYSELKSAGFVFEQEPTDQRWEWREAYLNDPDGNKICIYHAGIVRMNPEWRLPESKSQHMLTKESFTDWLEKYKEAWEGASPSDAAELFVENAKYYETPFDGPSTGRENIIKYWNAVPEEQLDVNFGYEIIHIYKDVGYCKWNASFVRKASGVKVKLDGIFEVTFDESGRGIIFREWWHRKES
jgi:catechol 2,3-dioxygenase-like lactoylglutathione lyase family enzyme